jgi:hypothetical protein
MEKADYTEEFLTKFFSRAYYPRNPYNLRNPRTIF